MTKHVMGDMAIANKAISMRSGDFPRNTRALVMGCCDATKDPKRGEARLAFARLSPASAFDKETTPVEMKAELQAMGHEPGPVLKAIRRKCLDCSGGSAAEVADCLVKNCALYPFRMGKNPWRVEMSP
jgi:hypothetical protein